MLAYLNVLVAAVARGEAAELERLLAHPMARTLTADAMGEVLEAADGTLRGAPLHLLQLRHQTAQLLGEERREHARLGKEVRRTVVAEVARPFRGPAWSQPELPLAM
jgi:hypothetical protein